MKYQNSTSLLVSILCSSECNIWTSSTLSWRMNSRKTFINLGSVMLPKNKSKYAVAAVNASEEFYSVNTRNHVRTKQLSSTGFINMSCHISLYLSNRCRCFTLNSIVTIQGVAKKTTERHWNKLFFSFECPIKISFAKRTLFTHGNLKQLCTFYKQLTLW